MQTGRGLQCWRALVSILLVVYDNWEHHERLLLGKNCFPSVCFIYIQNILSLIKCIRPTGDQLYEMTKPFQGNCKLNHLNFKYLDFGGTYQDVFFCSSFNLYQFSIHLFLHFGLLSSHLSCMTSRKVRMVCLAPFAIRIQNLSPAIAFTTNESNNLSRLSARLHTIQPRYDLYPCHLHPIELCHNLDPCFVDRNGAEKGLEGTREDNLLNHIT